MRRITIMFLVVALSVLFGTSSAQAAPETPKGVTPLTASFALACNFPSPSVNARARVDIKNVDVAPAGSDIDADDIWYRSLHQDNTQSTFTPDWVTIQVHSTGAISGWLKWTTRGGTTGDDVTVPSSYHWDPAGKTGTPGTYVFDQIRMVARTLSGTQCTSPAHAVS
jgi:hypothetical protein